MKKIAIFLLCIVSAFAFAFAGCSGDKGGKPVSEPDDGWTNNY